MNIENVVKFWNELSLKVEGNEEDGSYDINIDDKLIGIGLKYGFRGFDYIGENDLKNLSKNELEMLMNDLKEFKINFIY
jgi:hypothetical protein